MDWITILKAQQTDFIARIKSGDLLHCEKEGQHSELTVISGERLRQLRDFCWEMANKFKQQYDVKNIFFNNMKGKLGEEVVKIRLGDFVTEVDYEKYSGGDGKVDFTLTSDSSIGIQVKTRYGNYDQVQWAIDREEIEKNAVLVCVLCQEEFSDIEKEYRLIIAGFLPTNMIQSAFNEAIVGIDELLYPGGLRGYLENLKLFTYYDYHKYILLGDKCIDNQDYQGAINNYSQALKLNPKNAQIYFKRAETHHQLGNFRDAINDYSRAIYINPKDAYSYNNRGIIYEKFGYIHHAINDYEAALRINPKEAVVYLNLAITYYNLNEIDRIYIDEIGWMDIDEITISYLNQALNINPEFLKAYYVRGKFRFQRGDISGAFEDFNTIIKIESDYALHIYTYLAEVYYYQGSYYSEIGNKKTGLENLNLAANLYKKINNEFSYKHTIDYIEYVQSEYVEYNNDVDLKSALSMNYTRCMYYTRLSDLLAAGKWKEADEETYRVMLEIARQEEEGWLSSEGIDNFPCADLRTIDQLWVKYSNGKFGFSVQKKIYQSFGGTREYNQETWRHFGDKVGWRKGGKWLYYNDVTFDIKAPEGHLPTEVWGFFDISDSGDVGEWMCGGDSSLASRLVNCNI